MGKSTVSMAIFTSFLYVYQRDPEGMWPGVSTAHPGHLDILGIFGDAMGPQHGTVGLICRCEAGCSQLLPADSREI